MHRLIYIRLVTSHTRNCTNGTKPTIRIHHSFDDQVLDTPFSIEEVECAVSKLKSGGADGLQPVYITFGAPAINSWLLRIYNIIRYLKDIPPSLKLGVTIPILCRFSSRLDIPHHAQMAYRHGISCADANIATQEAFLHFIPEDEKPIVCFYDLKESSIL